MQVHDQVDEPVVVHGQEVLKVVDAPGGVPRADCCHVRYVL
jgi:hypothetical protein